MDGTPTIDTPETKDDSQAPVAPTGPAGTMVNSRRFQIPGDLIMRTTADYSGRTRELIRWAAGYCRERNLTKDEFGNLLRNKYDKPYSSDSIWKLFTGRRDESELGPIIDSIEQLRRSVEEVMAKTATGFIETSVTRAIWKLCRRAFMRHKLTFIFGESQIGKTVAITEYARQHNHGETTLVRMPASGGMAHFFDEMAIRLGISDRMKRRDIRDRIITSFDDRMLLIVDEAHQCLRGSSAGACQTLEFIREIHDRRKCGVVLVGTNILKHEITMGANSRMLRQLWLRAYAPLQLPAMPSDENLACFARAFSLEPPDDRKITVKFDDEGVEKSASGNPLELQRETIKRWGLGRWVTMLQEAAEDAKEAGRPNSWGRVIRVNARFEEMQTFAA